MSQISLPWIEIRTPETSQRYRRQAITALFGMGIPLVLLGIAVYLWAGLEQDTRLSGWSVAATIFLIVGPFATGMALLAGGLAVTFYRQIAALLQWGYVALMILIGGAIGACLIVWLHATLFHFIKSTAASPTLNQATEQTFLLTVKSLPAELTPNEIRAAIRAGDSTFHVFDTLGVASLAACLLWPLQFEIIRDVLALGGVIGFISIVPLFGIWWERKIAGRMQSRLGPMRVGGWHGWAQSLADGVKLIFKEDLIPKDGDQVLFRLAPYIAFVPAVCAFIALPFAGAYVFRDLDVALIFILAMLGIEVVGVILAGWASNNKWSVYGAMREACQMVSYEIPMGMALLIPVMTVGTLQLTAITEEQAGGFAS